MRTRCDAHRFEVVAASVNLPADALPPPPDERLAPMLAIERSPSNRARCHQCGVAIANGALRVVVELPNDPDADQAAGFEIKRRGYIHLACAPEYSKFSDGLDAYLAKRATKKDAKDVADFARARKLVPADLASAGDASIVGDWLEQYHQIVLPAPDLEQLIGNRAPTKKPAARVARKANPGVKRATPKARKPGTPQASARTSGRKPAKAPAPKKSPKRSAKTSSPTSKRRR